MTDPTTILAWFQAGRSVASVAALCDVPTAVVEDTIRAAMPPDEDVCQRCDGTGVVRDGPELRDCRECAS